MDENFLVAFVKVEVVPGRHRHFYQIWKRKSNYCEKSFFQSCPFSADSRSIMGEHLINVPIISDGNLVVFQRPLYSQVANFKYEIVNLAENIREERNGKIPGYSSPTVNFRLRGFEMISFELNNINFMNGNQLEPRSNLILRTSDRVLWKREFNNLNRIIGSSEEFVAILVWGAAFNNEVIIFDTKTGEQVRRFFVKTELSNFARVDGRVKEVGHRPELEVQIVKNRIAFKGTIRRSETDLENEIHDLNILDLKTGELILGFTREVPILEVQKFLMLEDNVIFEDSSHILVAKFWT